MEEKGIIDVVKQENDRFSLRINKVWYNSFGQCDLRKGDFVVVTFNDNGTFHNIKSIKKADAVINSDNVIKSFSVDARVDDIHLQVCLKIASEQLRIDGRSVPSPESVARYAFDLFKAVWGGL